MKLTPQKRKVLKNYPRTLDEPITRTELQFGHVILHNMNSKNARRNTPLKHGTVYAVIALPTYTYTESKQIRNIRTITSEIPYVTIFRASKYLDGSCIAVLKHLSVKMSLEYKDDECGVGWVHAGKIGKLCLFLLFILHCESIQAEYCVWLEDDVVLSYDRMNIIKQHIHDYKTPLVSLGKRDEIMIVVGKYTQKLLTYFTNYTVTNPLALEILRENTNMRLDLHLFDAGRYHRKKHSTSLCSHPLLSVNEINYQVNKMFF